MLAILVFLSGVAYYMYFRCQMLLLEVECEVVPFQILTSYPTFVHVFSFSVLHVILFNTRYWYGPIFWFVVNVVFEVGQVATKSGESSTLFASYFTNGVFDLDDLLAALIGAVVAFALLKLEYKSERQSPD